MLTNGIHQRIKECISVQHFKKSVNVFHHINKIKNKKSYDHLTEIEKASEKIQHFFS